MGHPQIQSQKSESQFGIESCLFEIRADLPNNGAIFLAWSACAVVVENCGGTIRGGFGGRAHDDDRAALLDVRGVKFLVADVIGLGGGIGADYGFQRAAFAEKFSETVMVG